MRLLRKYLIIIGCLVIVDVAVGYICKELLRNVPDNNSPLAIDKHNLLEENSDVVIMGASQVKHGYDPRVFSSILGMSAYNAAQDGIDVIQNYIYLKAIFDRRPPKVVILDLTHSYVNGHMKDRIVNMNMWYGISQPVTEFFNSQASWQEKLKLKSHLYVYNGLLHHLARMQLRKEVAYDGFVPFKGKYKGDYKKSGDFTADSQEVEYLDKIVRLCQTNHCQLIISRAPDFIVRTQFNAWLRDYCIKNQLPLIDHAEDRSFLDQKALFRDEYHLNDKGARLFSDTLAKEVKEKLKP